MRNVGVGILIALVVALFGWNYGASHWHLGAHLPFRPYACPAGDTYTVTWSPGHLTGPGTYYYHGWTASAGCSASLKVTVH